MVSVRSPTENKDSGFNVRIKNVEEVLMKLSGTDYDVVSYDEYIKEFEEQVLPEFKGEAEELLLRELEEKPRDGDNVEIHLDAEKTKEGIALSFVFDCQLSDESLDLVFRHFTQE